MTSHIEGLFRTSVNDAVQTSISERRALFVLLTKDDPESGEFIDSWTQTNGALDPEVKGILDRFVLLKLVANTVEFVYFEQIFPNLRVPSFYIVSNGKLVDVIHGTGTPSTFSARVSEKFTQEAEGNTNEPSPHVETPNIPEPENPNSNAQIPSTAQPTSTTQNRPATSNSPSPAYSNSQSISPPPVFSSSPNPDVNQQNSSSFDEHQLAQLERVRKHKIEVAAQRSQQEREKRRLRDLLKADQRERVSRQREEEQKYHEPALPQATIPKQDSGICSLSIKLFDGNSIRCEFKSTQSLNDVRNWLDTESGVEIIPQTNAMPSFATSSTPQPTHYVFHSPIIPRVTFEDEDEFKSLAELGLTPRSALILKPIYEEKGFSNSYPSGTVPNHGVIRTVGSAIGRFGNALYSFFDYGVVDRDPHQFTEDEENLDDESPSSRSTGNSGSRLEEPYPQRNTLSRSDTPNLVSIDDARPAQASLINFEDSQYRNRSTTSIPSLVQPEAERPGSAFNSRPSTPLSMHRPKPPKRVHTIKDDDKEKETNSYNGNSVNVSKKEEDE